MRSRRATSPCRSPRCARFSARRPDGADWIATAPRVGYRFAGPVEALPERLADQPAEAAPSIAVLPFENLGQEIEQQHFADGLAEDIITRLSRLRWLFVSARNSSFTFRGKPLDIREIGRALGVRYVLNGSVRRSGQRIRIGAQLSDASTGGQVWADRYDVELADFFALQDEIAGSVIGAIEPQLYAAEHQRFRSRRPESLDAWGFVMKAMPYVWTWLSSKDMTTAQELLRSALDIRPDYPRAISLLAWTLATGVHRDVVENLLPPGINLVRMHPVPLRSGSRILPQRLKRNLRLERRIKLLA